MHAITGSTLTLAAQVEIVPFLLAAIVVLGVGAQWVAWRLKIPSILLLLLTGILVGPVFRWAAPTSPLAKKPDELLGNDLLLALVGMAVALILYEGGLSLRFKEIRGVKTTVVALVTVGALITWTIATITAYLFLGLPPRIALLLGAILIVTGPTVIGPMLAHIRPAGAVGPILKWEGIVIDPIGVAAAVLVFEAIVIGQGADANTQIAMGILKTLVIGGGLGALAAFLLLALMSRFMIPDFLQNPFSLMLVIATFTISNTFQAESGLFATTLMGIILANQTRADVRHIIEFKENLRVLLISALFIILGARLGFADLEGLDWWSVAAFVIVLITVARPIAVFISTIGAGLSWNERMFLSSVAPRGIVAAAAASIFALALEQRHVAGADQLVPLTFSVIIGTVAIYGLAATPMAKLLGVSDQNPQGVLFIGAPRWARALGVAIQQRKYPVLFVDTNRANIRAARMEGLPAVNGNILSEYAVEELDLRGVGRVLAVTPNDEVNALALQRFTEVFEKSGLYLLPARAAKKGEGETSRRVGRRLFSSTLDFAQMESRIANGWVVKTTTLSPEFTAKDYQTLYGRAAVPLFILRASGTLAIVAPDRPIEPENGDAIVALVNPEELFMPGAIPRDESVQTDDS
ncbi:MAG: sodium:proton antiporter [Phycisphaerales bacterium]